MSITNVDKVDFWYGSEDSYDTISHGKGLFFAPDTKQILLDSIKYIPKNLSELFNDAGYITSSAIANKADKATTLAGYGITDAVDLTSAQTISGAKTFSNLKVSNTTLVPNLNADMLDGKHAEEFAYVNTNIKVSAYDRIYIGYGSADGGFKSYGPAINIGTTNGYGMLMQMALDDGNIYTKARRRGELDENWKQLAFTGSNVASATKLQTARTLWGQSFDGTANVTGAMSGVTSLNSLLYLNSTGLGIGTTSPSAKLHVAGDALISGNLIANGTTLRFGVGGQNNLYLYSDVADQLYIHTSKGIPFLIQGAHIRRGKDLTTATLGTDQYKWANVYTEAMKLGDASFTYDSGTLTIDKAVTVGGATINGDTTISSALNVDGMLNARGGICIGDNVYLTWDNTNQMLRVSRGLYSVEAISAGGKDTTEGSTALENWNGSSNITTLGTITSGVWNGTAIENSYIANPYISIAGEQVSLGGRISSATFKTKLGLQDLAYKASLAFSELADKPTTLLGYGITDAVDTSANQEINGVKTFNDEVEFNSRAYFSEDVQVDGVFSCEGDCEFANTVRIGGTNGVTLYYDTTNDCLRIDKGVASDSFISAGGVDSSNSTIAELQQRIATLEAQIASLTNN